MIPCRARGGREGDLLFMGLIHIDNAPHRRPFRKLHATAQEDSSCTRNRPIDLRR